MSPEQQELFDQHQWLAQKYARRYARKDRRLTYEEIENAALVGLWRATQGFRPERGSFEAYASFCCRGSIIDYVRGVYGKRRNLPQRTVSLDAGCRDTEGRSRVHQKLAVKSDVSEKNEFWEEMCVGLTEDDKVIVLEHFRGGLTQKKCGEMLGITKDAVSLRKKNLLLRMRVSLVGRNREMGA